MHEQYVTHIELQQYHSSWYSEREAAKMSHLSLAALRHLHTLGLVVGDQFDGQLHYSQEEIIEMRKIRRLQHDLGINLAGVEVILHLLKHFDDVSQQLEYERQRLLQQENTGAPPYVLQREESEEP